MPIVEPPAPEAPLDQGDILRGVPLIVSGADGKAKAGRQAPFVMVISRRCDATRATLVTVAPVFPHPIHLNEVQKKLRGDDGQAKNKPKALQPGESLDAMRRFLAGIRDGGQYFDAFYLGSIDAGSPTRFAAQLETLFTIEVPEGPRRREFIEKHRMWRLSGEFIQDLHFRLSASYARLGFDDYSWFADSDLDVLLTFGEAEITERTSAVDAVVKNIQTLEAANEQVKAPLRAELDKKKADLDSARFALAPYVQEKQRRQKAQSP